MNKGELIAQVAQESGVSKKDTAVVLESILDIITQTLAQGDSVSFIGFGTFSTSTRSARVGVNPSNGQKIDIAASTVAKFKAGAKLKEAVKRK